MDNIGVSTLQDSTAFKKIQFFSKTNPSNLFNVKSDFQNSFQKVSNLYFTDLELNNSYTYGMDRQHTYTPLAASLPNFSTLLDKSGLDKFTSYSLNNKLSRTTPYSTNINRLNYFNNQSAILTPESAVHNIHKLLPSKFSTLNNLDLTLFLKVPNIVSVLAAENDSKQYSNNFKFMLNFKHKKKQINNLTHLLTASALDESLTNNPRNNFSNSLYNTENNLKFKDYKSNNAQFLGSERTARLLTNLNSNSYK